MQQRGWRTLVHVCQRWRYIVFESPRGLDLRFYYAGVSPTKILDLWPAARIEIRNDFKDRELNYTCADNLVTIFGIAEYRNRVCGIRLSSSKRWVWERLAPVLQKPFPELSTLILQGDGHQAAVLPDSFLGGSAPRLRSLELIIISLPSMEKLLLSANRLVALVFWCPQEYISPQALATYLSVMIRLDYIPVPVPSIRASPRAGKPTPTPTLTLHPSCSHQA